MASWYEKADAFLGGILPGGASPSTPFFSSAEEAAAGGISGYPAPRETQYPLAPMGQQALAMGGVSAVGPAAPRGRLVTMIARAMPDGTMVPVKAVPGGVSLFARDLSAVRRVKSVMRRLGRFFPRRAAIRRMSFRVGGGRARAKAGK